MVYYLILFGRHEVNVFFSISNIFPTSRKPFLRPVCPPLPHRFLFGKPFQKRPTGPSHDLFLLSIGWINRERSVNSVIQIYDKEEPNGLIYETDEAGIEQKIAIKV